MITREIADIIPEYRKAFPVLAFTGARQTGKTTLLQGLFPDYQYINLEEISMYNRVKEDPAAFVNPSAVNVIIDEVQRIPELLSQIQATVDQQKKMGSYILSGSQNLLLSEKISQSLAGRAAYVELPGLTLSELASWGSEADFFERIFHGFYPAVYDRDIRPTVYYDQYISTFVERDVRLIKNISNLDAFRDFLRLLAGTVGRPFNASAISGNLGVSPNTVRDWLSILEATYIIFRLRPYCRNIGKQIAKSPKIYFYDTGLLCFLLGITSRGELETHYLIGSLFENLIIADIKKSIMNRKGSEKMFFYRDKQAEVDLILNKGAAFRPVEIKKAKTYTAAFTKGLKYWTNNIVDETMQVKLPHIVYTGDTADAGSMFRLLNWKDATKELLAFQDW